MKPRVNEIILTIYLCIACISSVYLYVTHDHLYLVLILLGMAVGFYFLSHVVMRKLSVWEIGTGTVLNDGSEKNATRIVRIFVIASLICFIFLLIWFIAFNPGSYEEDNVNQYGQVIAGVYDSWHPIWHTLMFFTMPLKLTGQAWSVIMFQIICFSLTQGYLFTVIYKYAGPYVSAIVYAYILLNPYTGFILMYPFKDVAFAIAGTVAMCMACEIYMTHGAWGDKRIRCILLGFALANATLFRYNGVIFTGLLLLVLIFHLRIRRWIYVCAAFILTMVVISGPVYRLTEAAQSPVEVIQTVGFPMAIIGNVAKETPELMDEETRDFVYSLSTPEIWEERYQRGDFNLMKYGGIYNPGVIEDKGVLPIVKMAFRCLVRSPQASMDAIFSLTDFVYGLDIRDKADIDVVRHVIVDNDYGITEAGNETLARILLKVASVMKLKGWNFVRKLGFMVLLVVIALLSKLKWNSADSLKKISLCLPILAYDFGTMLLLSGHDSRFFFISFTICPLVCVMMFIRRGDMSTAGN